jgi:hypothetical protein
MGGGGTNVKPQSLDSSANTLLELSALLQAGRPELALTERLLGHGSGDEAEAG